MGNSDILNSGRPKPLGEPVSIGRVTLRGKIIDSKCHLGVMKPGRGAPHKACAVRCISGGIPPVLRVEISLRCRKPANINPRRVCRGLLLF